VQNNQFRVTVVIEDPSAGGVPTAYGVWDKVTGGDVTSSIRKYQPGGGQKEIVLGGKRTRSDLVVSRMCDVDRDWALIETLEQWVGIADATITLQATRPNFDTSGIKPRPIRGKLTGVNSPDADSESEEPGMLALTFTVTA
jgi:hypothetical protein